MRAGPALLRLQEGSGLGLPSGAQEVRPGDMATPSLGEPQVSGSMDKVLDLGILPLPPAPAQPSLLPHPTWALNSPGVMPGGCRLSSRGCPLAPASQALALSTGSQLMAVFGNTSSWKNSFCR
jgi:hypothetical protein